MQMPAALPLVAKAIDNLKEQRLWLKRFLIVK